METKSGNGGTRSVASDLMRPRSASADKLYGALQPACHAGLDRASRADDVAAEFLRWKRKGG
jgi:hypothetical protein